MSNLSNSSGLGPRVARALSYALVVHGGQTRKGSSVPYISHPLAVVSLTLEHGGNEDDAIAALLHDAAEDQEGNSRLNDIDAHFGSRVTHIIEQCSDIWANRKLPAKLRRDAYFERLLLADESTLLVCGSERLHNLRAVVMGLRNLGNVWWDRYNIESPKKEGTLWYYGEYLRVFRKIAERVNAAELTIQLIDEYEAVLQLASERAMK